MVEGQLTHALSECKDLVAVLLMARVNYQHQLIMSKRRVPGLDAYLDRVTLLLWPRFTSLFEVQIDAIKAVTER